MPRILALVYVYKIQLSVPVRSNLRPVVPDSRSEARNITSEYPGDQPVKRYLDLITYRHTLRQISRSPQNPRCPSLDLVRTALVNGSPVPQVGHRAPIMEFERLLVEVALVERLG